RDLELFLSDCDRLYPDLHSFPTRRSSDLYFALRGSIYSHIVVSVRAAYQTRRITLSLLMLLSRLRRVHDRTHDSPTIGSVCLLHRLAPVEARGIATTWGIKETSHAADWYCQVFQSNQGLRLHHAGSGR